MPQCAVRDDFFGAAEQGVFSFWGFLLDVLSLALGFPYDNAKSSEAGWIQTFFWKRVTFVWVQNIVEPGVGQETRD